MDFKVNKNNKMKCRQQCKQLHEFNDAQLNYMAGSHRMVTSPPYYANCLLIMKFYRVDQFFKM